MVAHWKLDKSTVDGGETQSFHAIFVMPGIDRGKPMNK
jgi:hypothetical protein